MFAGAGLSSAVSDVVNDKALTFLRRADRHHLGSVSVDDVRPAIREPVELFGRTIGDDALAAVAQGTGGCPFLIQLVGHRTWRLHPGTDDIGIDDAAEGARQAAPRTARRRRSVSAKGR